VRRPAALLAVVVAAVGVALLPGSAGAAGAGIRLGPRGALLAPAAHPSTVTLAAGAPCQALLSGPGGQCGTVAVPGGALLYTIEPGPVAVPGLASRPWTVTVYRTSGPGRWRAVLRTRASRDEPGPLFATVTARVAELTGDGQTLVLGYRSEGTGGFLDIDLVVATRSGPRVAAHSVLAQGTAVVQPRQVVTYTAVYRARDANCCPSSIERDIIRARGTSFVVVGRRRLATNQVTVPPSDLG